MDYQTWRAGCSAARGMATARDMAAHDWDRVVDDYFGEIVSPLRAGIPGPLARALARIPNARRKTVGDLGCGIGTLLPALARRFGHVVAIDFSPGMVARARAACDAAHVRVHRADLAHLGRFRATLDVAVTVNAFLSADPNKLGRMFASLHGVLKPDGTLLGIFPAMEPVVYQGLLIHDRERRRSRHAHRARSRADRILERDKFDFVHGTYRADDGGAQKFFYGFELTYRLRQVGFRRIRLGRVCYDWDDVGGYERFPGEPPMWDWFVRAEASRATPVRRRS